MATETILSQLKNTVDSILVDNTTALISAEDLRVLFKIFLTYSVDSSFEIWREAGHVGTKGDFLASFQNRINHTGIQAIGTVAGLQAGLDSKTDKVVGKQLSTNDYTDGYKDKVADVLKSTYYFHERGYAEYLGASVYSQPAIGIAKKTDENIVFNRIRMSAWGQSNTVGFISIYKASNLVNLSTSGTFLLSNLTLLEKVYIKSGDWNTDPNSLLEITTKSLLSVQKNEYLYIICQVVSGSNVQLKYWNMNTPANDRLPIIFSLNASPTLYSSPYYYGTSTYLSTPPVLDISSTAFCVKKSDINIPKVIYGATGREMNIWKNQLVIDSENSTNKIDFFCAVGANKERCFRYTPSVIGSNAITIDLNGYTKFSTVSSILKNTGTGAKNVLVIGDSFVQANTIVSTIKDNNTADGGMNFTMVGTQGVAPYKHEGRGGWTYGQYATSASSPFLFSGNLNFNTYTTNNSISGIDVCVIVLGTNDVFSSSITEQQLAVIITNAKLLISRLLTDYPNVKIVVSMPTLGGTQDGFGANYGASVSIEQFKTNMLKLHSILLDTFDENRFSSSVRLAPCFLFVDKLYGFQRGSVSASSRESTAVQESNNGVHPSTSGYQQFADSLYGTILSFF